MAGDGGRVPDVSEQRAGVAVLRWNKLSGWNCDRVPADWPRERTEVARHADPASVLAALLAESPEATVAAIEALLTSDEAVQAAYDVIEDDVQAGPSIESVLELAQDSVMAAVRSLLSKAPKEDG
jgi:hypothetical protein